MVILGLLLLIAAIVAAIAAAVRGDVSVHVDLEWFTLKTNAGVIFFLGAAAMLVFVLGWWMVARGMRKGRERRREVKALRKRAETSEEVARREHEARVSERNNNGVGATQGSPDADDTSGQHVEPSARER
jgi:membrane protein implicated in regulation of membrane protease activity